MHIKLSPFRSSPLEVFSKEDAPRNEEKPQENTNTEARSQQSGFATLLKSNPCTDTPPDIPAHLQNTDSGRTPLEYWFCKRILKVWYYEKLLFTVVKRNSLAIKMYYNNNNNNSNNNNNKSNKYLVIVSRSPRNALRFLVPVTLTLIKVS